jgi:hypothetical protein
MNLRIIQEQPKSDRRLQVCMLSQPIRRVPTRFPTSRRYLSGQNTCPISSNHPIYLSASTNPYFNLTFEDWFVNPFGLSCNILTESMKWKAIQTQSDRETSSADISRRTMRRHRTQSKSVERGQFPSFEEGRSPVYSETEWRRDCISCTYFCASFW